MQPGEVFFERFGHDAIVVLDEPSGQATSYNFGFFDPNEAGFVPRFARGDMQYYLVALPLEQDLVHYRETGRGVYLQWLDLTAAQSQQIAGALATRALPANARYHYDYFTSNCSTQVRDVLNQALAGTLKSQLVGRSRGDSYRNEALRLASPALWMWLGFDLGFGPQADTIMSLWDEAYVPTRLAHSLREVQNTQGRPLVQSEQTLLPHHAAPEPAEIIRPWWPWLIAGLILAAITALAGRSYPRMLIGVVIPCWLMSAMLGVLMIFLWGLTQHQAAWANQNILLFNPLSLLLIPGAITILRGREPGVWFARILNLIVMGATVAWVLHWLPITQQSNQHWIALLLPIHLGLAYVFSREHRLPQ